MGEKIFSKKRDHFRKLSCKFIHFFAFNYKDLREITLETHKIELIQNANAMRQKPDGTNPKYAKMAKIELEKLVEA